MVDESEADAGPRGHRLGPDDGAAISAPTEPWPARMPRSGNLQAKATHPTGSVEPATGARARVGRHASGAAR